jgi:aspartyl-tRNA(Asn)/glutamyl-tRNA(Gln) amidotransferase subunit C
MKITKDIIEHFSDVSRIYLTEAEKDEMVNRINSFLFYADKLNEVDTENIEPTPFLIQNKAIYREDNVKESLPTEDVFKNAPEHEDGFFKVPRIIE